MILEQPYAYTTLVMNKPHYVKGALAMAHSLKLTNTSYPIICMATYDIYDRYKNCLKSVFDEVILVSYIKHKTESLATSKQHDIYKEWKDISFTKWNCLNLYKYDKVCLLDADLIIKKNIDHLFELKTPAGCFGNNWDSLVNYYDKLAYGDLIDNKKIYKGLENGYVVNGHCVVLEPGKKIFNRFISFMNNNLYRKNKLCKSMSDENALVKFLLSEKKTWSQISKDYNCIPWKNDNDAFILHFFNKVKAWQMNRDKYPDVKIWYDVWDSLQKKYPITKSLM
jgi:alpha-N-acetylglucosamine transferase